MKRTCFECKKKVSGKMVFMFDADISSFAKYYKSFKKRLVCKNCVKEIKNQLGL